MLSPRNSFSTTYAPDRAFETSLAGMGENEEESNSGGVSGSNVVDRVGGRNDMVGGIVIGPAGMGVMGREASEAGGGIVPSNSADRERTGKITRG